MSKFWKSANKVKCPLYQGERDRCIVCEGLIGESMQNKFASPEEKHKYQKENCYRYPNECVLFKTAERMCE